MFLHWVLYQLTIVMSKTFRRSSNNSYIVTLKSSDNLKKNVNLFIIFARFDIILSIQLRIESFLSSWCYLKYRKMRVRVS